jgi:hypothetical protein
MIKSIVILGAAAALAASVTAGQAVVISNGQTFNALYANVIVGNALKSNVVIANALTAHGGAGAAFTIESIEMPDGTLAAR